jgi:tRNA dimethylallyltransferase
LLAELGPAALHARLAYYDPQTAAGLRPADSQRVARAWEVWRGTGRGLAAWHSVQRDAEPDLSLRAILIDPPREDLRSAIAVRFAAMVAGGALEEVDALLGQRLDPALPAMRAHGVPELAAYLRGEMPLAQAEANACLATAQYTKRQGTWFRHRTLVAPAQLRKLLARITHREQFSCSWMADMQNFIFSTIDAVQHGQ